MARLEAILMLVDWNIVDKAEAATLFNSDLSVEEIIAVLDFKKTSLGKEME